MNQSARTIVFRVSDLTSKRITPPRGGLGAGSVGYLGPDQDPDDFTPITPWVMLGKAYNLLDFIDKADVANLDMAVLDRAALDVGRNIVAGKFFPGTALCTEDMPTCARNERISPFASLGESFTNIDLGVLRQELTLAIERIDRFEKKFG
jgi:hypothetical protein